MGELSDKFHKMLAGHDDDKKMHRKIAKMVFDAPDTAESRGLKALMYHEGIGVPVDFDKCFELAEKAAAERDGLGLFLLGYMCDNVETPDQAGGGPRQKYDQYDASIFYEECVKVDSRWKAPAHKWLGDYYMDMAQGGDPEVAVEHYEAIADEDGEAACVLCDYYMGMESATPDELRTDDLDKSLMKWTEKAAAYAPEEYSYVLGCLYAEGIGCRTDRRTACKYWKEAFDTGDWRGADAIAMLLEERLETLQADDDEAERRNCMEEIALWRSLAQAAREKAAAEEPDPSIEED